MINKLIARWNRLIGMEHFYYITVKAREDSQVEVNRSVIIGLYKRTEILDSTIILSMVNAVYPDDPIMTEYDISCYVGYMHRKNLKQ
jgi:hypothetical protein